MADSKHIITFIWKWEGYGGTLEGDSGGETRKGVTYATWCSMFGNQAHERFQTMSDMDWNEVFHQTFWNQILGDQIASQRIADILVDWIWGSGKHYPEVDVQTILNSLFGEHLAVDGNFGQHTIEAINRADEQSLWDDIVKKRFEYLEGCVKAHPVNERFLQGWKNRLNDLITFENANS